MKYNPLQTAGNGKNDIVNQPFLQICIDKLNHFIIIPVT